MLKVVKFERSPEGLYYYNLPTTYISQLQECNNKNNEKQQLITTVAENRANFSTQQFERAKVARKLYHNIGAPTIKNFKLILQSNMIKNCPVTIEDVNIAEQIWGPDISYLKGKTTRTKPKAVIGILLPSPFNLSM